VGAVVGGMLILGGTLAITLMFEFVIWIDRQFGAK